MFRISYIDNSSDEILHKNFEDTKKAEVWVIEQGDKITALKLLVWDEYINCYSTLRTY